MQTVTTALGALDRCPACLSLWIEQKLVTAYSDDKTACREALDETKALLLPVERWCPKCFQKLQDGRVRSRGVVLQLCTHCETLWCQWDQLKRFDEFIQRALYAQVEAALQLPMPSGGPAPSVPSSFRPTTDDKGVAKVFRGVARTFDSIADSISGSPGPVAGPIGPSFKPAASAKGPAPSAPSKPAKPGKSEERKILKAEDLPPPALTPKAVEPPPAAKPPAPVQAPEEEASPAFESVELSTASPWPEAEPVEKAPAPRLPDVPAEPPVPPLPEPPPLPVVEPITPLPVEEKPEPALPSILDFVEKPVEPVEPAVPEPAPAPAPEPPPAPAPEALPVPAPEPPPAPAPEPPKERPVVPEPIAPRPSVLPPIDFVPAKAPASLPATPKPAPVPKPMPVAKKKSAGPGFFARITSALKPSAKPKSASAAPVNPSLAPAEVPAPTAAPAAPAVAAATPAAPPKRAPLRPALLKPAPPAGFRSKAKEPAPATSSPLPDRIANAEPAGDPVSLSGIATPSAEGTPPPASAGPSKPAALQKPASKPKDVAGHTGGWGMRLLPWVLVVIAFVVNFSRGYDFEWGLTVLWCLCAWAVGTMVRLWRLYPSGPFEEQPLAALLERQGESAAKGRPVRLSGLLEPADPSKPKGPLHFVQEGKTLALNRHSPMDMASRLAGLSNPAQLSAGEVILTGWFRVRAGEPFIEVASAQWGKKKRSSTTRAMRWGGAILVLLLSALILLTSE